MEKELKNNYEFSNHWKIPTPPANRLIKENNAKFINACRADYNFGGLDLVEID